MNLFIYNKETLEVDFHPELLLLKPFKDIISKNKKNISLSRKEIAFVFFFADVKSDYMYITDEELRIKELVKDLELPAEWKPDEYVLNAVEFYKNRSTTINTTLYTHACKAAADISNYLSNTDLILNERDAKGKPITDITKIVNALTKVPIIMKNLTMAHQELLKEQEILEGRSKGSKQFNMYEDGLEFE